MTEYIIYYGKIKSGVTKYYHPVVATETWNFEENPIP